MTDEEFVDDVYNILKKTIPEQLHDRLEPNTDLAPSIVEFNAVYQLVTMFVEMIGTARIESDPLLYSIWSIVRAYTLRIPKPSPDQIKDEINKVKDIIQQHNPMSNKQIINVDEPKLPGMYL